MAKFMGLKNRKGDNHLTRNKLVNKYVCNFISKRWILNRLNAEGKEVTRRKYAKECNLATSTITKILTPDGYNIPLSTINSICQKEELPLSQFFIEFEKVYGISIMDDFLKKPRRI